MVLGIRISQGSPEKQDQKDGESYIHATCSNRLSDTSLMTGNSPLSLGRAIGRARGVNINIKINKIRTGFCNYGGWEVPTSATGELETQGSHWCSSSSSLKTSEPMVLAPVHKLAGLRSRGNQFFHLVTKAGQDPWPSSFRQKEFHLIQTFVLFIFFSFFIEKFFY